MGGVVATGLNCYYYYRMVKGFKDECGHARLQSILRLACKASRRLGKLVCNVTWHPNWGQVFRKYYHEANIFYLQFKSNTVILTIEFRLRRFFSGWVRNRNIQRFKKWVQFF